MIEERAHFPVSQGRKVKRKRQRTIRMITRRHILPFVLLLLAGVSTGLPLRAGPAVPLDPSKAITQYRIDQWTTEHGLPMNRVQVLFQSSNGYIWLGTQEGLARFDGFNFSVFDSRNSVLPGNDISSLAEDAEGNLWIGTYGGLVRYRNGRFTSYTTEDGLVSNQIHALEVDTRGQLWIGTQSGVSIYRHGTFRNIPPAAGLGDKNIRAIHQDAEGSIWFATLDAGLARWGGGRTVFFTTKSGLPSNAVTAIHEGADGTLFIGTKSGLATLKKGKIRVTTSIDGLAGNLIRAIWEDSAGALWIGTEGGGLSRSYAGAMSSYSDHGTSSVLAVTEDREGSLWVGTQQGGLVRIQDGKFSSFGLSEGLGNDYVYSIVEGASGDMWFGTQGGGVSRSSRGKVETYSTGNGLPSDYIGGMYASRDGSVWIGTLGGGLLNYSDGRFVRYTESDGLPDSRIFNIHEDSRGDLWMGTNENLVRFDGRKFTTYTSEDGLTHNIITTVAEGPDGVLWVGTYRGGVNLIKNGIVAGSYTTENGLPRNNVTSIYIGGDGVAWVATQEGGLSRIQDGRVSTITTDQGLYNGTILQILEDDGGNFWMSSNKGLFRIAKDQIHAVLNGTAASVTSDVFDRGDGLRTFEFNGGAQPAGWKDSMGRLWFASNKGAVSVDPKNILTNSQAPPIVIERMLAGGVPIWLDSTIVLEPSQNKIEIDFVGLSYIASDEVIYRYKLDGVDEDWVEAGTRRQAFYTNLPPGHYTFHVLARNADGVWTETPASIAFYHEPFFYQTWWFVLLSTLMMLAGGVGVYKLRVRQLTARQRELEKTVEERTHDLREEKEKVEEAKAVIEEQAEQLRELDKAKTRFFGNISHEFRTPLTLTIGPLENALSGVYGPVPENLKKQLEIMLRNAKRLLRLINQLLDLSKLESGRMELHKKRLDMVQFAEGVSTSFTSYTEKSGIDLTFVTEETQVPVLVDPEAMEKVVFNLLSNAIKFTPEGGKIEVGVARVGEAFVAVHVKDSGTGIPEKEVPHIFDRFHQVEGATSRVQAGTGIGLALVKEVVELHEGRISVESELGVGTKFTITLPLGSSDEPLVDANDELGYTVSHAPMEETVVRDIDDSQDRISGDGAIQDHVVKNTMRDVTILVTDDNPDIREYMIGCLSGTYSVISAKNGSEAYEKAKQVKPDLIISDVMMPVMSGYDLCRAIRADEDLRLTPLILVTSKTTVEEKIEGLEAGADDYLPKPFNAEELFARVRNLLTLRKQQKALQELAEMLQVKNGELKDASELKSQLLRIAAHDLKNPLNNIREFANLIQEEIDPESEIAEMLGLIKNSSNKMLELITQILESEALESGQLEIEKKPVDLAAVAAGVVDENRKQAERKEQEIVFEITGGESYIVDGSEEWLVEAMENLISNAIKYSPIGKSIWINVRREEDLVAFEVRDQGPGLSQDDQTKLFQKFQRLSTRPTGGESSTGLGLSIVKQIVEMHDGTIRVDSTLMEGSAFIILLAASQQEGVMSKD